MPNPEPCSRPGCSQPVVITFCQENICLSHFCSDCYELLERFDSGTRSNGSHTPEELLVPNECARAALEISLRAKSLDNLERARLLDILLWSGDITNSFRRTDVGTQYRAAEREIRGRFGRVELRRNKAQTELSS
jgi:hypothetical protein